MSPFWFTFLKFFTVGGFGFGIDFFSTWILKEKLQLKKFQANTIGFIFGVIFRFFANKYWAFANTDENWLYQMFQFGLIALVGLGIVSAVIYILNEKFKILDFYKAKIVAMVIYMFWNFSANYLWTFA